MMFKAIGIGIVALAVVVLKVLLAQWLLGLFGWHFSFLTVCAMLFVIEVVFGSMFAKK